MIDFAVWSPDEPTFWNSWITAGICSAPRVFTPEYSDFIVISDQSIQGWTPTKPSGQMIEGPGGTKIPERVAVPGWHANVRVGGELEKQFTHGLPQVDKEGKPIPLFDRTWAAEVFSLTATEIDPETGFKSGYQNKDGIRYADISLWQSPANVWA
jgi:hypothetical protein